jgi:hypothetical protein
VRLERGRRPLPGEATTKRRLLGFASGGGLGFRRLLRQVDAARLEQRHPPGAPGEVVGRGVEQRAEQHRPKGGVLDREGVACLDGLAAGCPLGDAQSARKARLGQAEVEDVVEPEIAHRVLGAPAQ